MVVMMTMMIMIMLMAMMAPAMLAREHRDCIYCRGLNNYQHYFFFFFGGGSWLELQYSIPQNPFLIIRVPILSHGDQCARPVVFVCLSIFLEHLWQQDV